MISLVQEEAQWDDMESLGGDMGVSQEPFLACGVSVQELLNLPNDSLDINDGMTREDFRQPVG